MAARAREALTVAGYAPTMVTGDGLAGYDRLIAACAVRYIPLPCLRQVRNGGTIRYPGSPVRLAGRVGRPELGPPDQHGRAVPNRAASSTAAPHRAASRAGWPSASG